MLIEGFKVWAIVKVRNWIMCSRVFYHTYDCMNLNFKKIMKNNKKIHFLEVEVCKVNLTNFIIIKIKALKL